jgi:molecular chaperone DnaK
MVNDSERYRQEDADLRQLVDARNELDATVHLVGRRLTELGANAPVHEKARAEMLVGDAEQALKEEAPLDRLRSLTSELQSVYQGLSAQGSPPPGSAGGGATPEGADDDVIDAEFTPS